MLWYPWKAEGWKWKPRGVECPRWAMAAVAISPPQGVLDGHADAEAHAEVAELPGPGEAADSADLQVARGTETELDREAKRSALFCEHSQKTAGEVGRSEEGPDPRALPHRRGD
jgi:hypothetical protein